MKREIKFRAWDSKYKKFLFPYPEGFNVIGEVTAFDLIGQQLHENEPNTPVLERINDVELMQYTGLKDKQGFEIYEGDIINYSNPYNHKEYTHIVKWDEMWSCFGLFEPDNKWCKENDWQKIKEVEVIGNQFENPELLQL